MLYEVITGVLDHLVHVDSAEFDHARTGNRENLFRARVVPVVAARHAGFANADRDLAAGAEA